MTTTQTFVRLATTVVAPAAALAVTYGQMGWSGENMKQEIVTVPNATRKLLSL